MSRSSRQRHRREGVVGNLKLARLVGAATTLTPTHHPRLPRPASSVPSGFLAEAPRLLVSSCITASGTVNQRPLGARGLSMRGETIREHDREGRTGSRSRHSAGPPRETSAHATPCFQ